MFRTGSVLRAAKKASTTPFFIRKMPADVIQETKAKLHILNSMKDQMSPELQQELYHMHQRSMGNIAGSGIDTKDLIARTRAAIQSRLDGTFVLPDASNPGNAEEAMEFKYITADQLSEIEKGNPEVAARLKSDYQKNLAEYPDLALKVDDSHLELQMLKKEAIDQMLQEEIRQYRDDSVGKVHRAKFSFATVEDYLQSDYSLASNFKDDFDYQKNFNPEKLDVFPTPSGLALNLSADDLSTYDYHGEDRGYKAIAVLLSSFAVLYGCSYLLIWRNDRTAEWMQDYEAVQKTERAFAYSYGKRYDDIELE